MLPNGVVIAGMHHCAESISSVDAGDAQAVGGAIATQERNSFFQRIDWLAFGLTVTIVLTIYLYTAAPEVTLESSGVYATAAAYGGVNCPPGLPLWTLYAWLFTKLVPFSNVAWRIGASSAVAGALACGIISLMVSRGGAMILEGMDVFRRLRSDEERRLRVIAAVVAGTAFGFHRSFWGRAVIVDPTAFTILLFVITLCLLLRWTYSPEQNQWFYATFFAFGLTLSSELWLAVAIPGLPFVVLFGKPSLGRDLFFAMASGLGLTFVAARNGLLPEFLQPLSYSHGCDGPPPLYTYYLFIAIGAGIICVLMTIITRRLLTHFGKVCIAGFLFFVALLLYVCVPLASMTTPPVNWGYARTVEGFLHTLTRGQFERLNPASVAGHPGRAIEIAWLYTRITIHDLGIIHVLPALIPFLFLNKMRLRERGWILGLAAIFLCLSFFLGIMLNSTVDRSGVEMTGIFYPPSHVILAIWEGYGLCLLGTLLARKRHNKRGFVAAI